jgi:hypothetical protein
MTTKPNIVELTVGDDLINLDQTASVLVKGETDIVEMCERLRDATPSRIAFVTPNAKRSRRRLTASLGLTGCFGCPCRVFSDEESARRWLES